MRRLSQRENGLLAITGVLIACSGLWVFWSDAWTQRQTSLERLKKIDRVHALLLRVPAPKGANPVADVPLARRITQNAASQNLSISRLDPQGDAMAVTMDSVAFDRLLGWIESVSAAGSTKVLSVEIGRRPEPGIVSARILFGERL